VDLITAANIPLFFESTKFAKQILQFLLQNKSNKANWTNWTNWTPDARGWTPGGPEGEISRIVSGAMDKQQTNKTLR
jgi:hypothetical protein